MYICKSKEENFGEIKEIYERAKEFMAENGNPGQWVNGYPYPELILEDIKNGNSYLVKETPESEEASGCFVFIKGEDETYRKINGSWLNEKPYGTIHRIASKTQGKGIMHLALEFCFKQTDNLRIDTHENNRVMRSILEKEGFTFCGIIETHNGTERLAFQKSLY